MVFSNDLTTEQKLAILADAAKYDVACTSSGVDRGGKEGSIGNTAKAGICHTFAADGRCISLLKILYTNECIFDCKYCLNRSSNDIERATFTPEEVCTLTMEFYRRNYIEGLFLSSGIVRTPDYTMEQLCKTLMLLREKYHFHGYIHCKSVPSASDELVELCGWYADRMSVNLELPTAEGLRLLAPHKSRKSILRPMRQIQGGIEESRRVLGMKGGNKGAYWHTNRMLEGKTIDSKREEDASWLDAHNAKGRKGLTLLNESSENVSSQIEEATIEHSATNTEYFDDDLGIDICNNLGNDSSHAGHMSIKEYNKKSQKIENKNELSDSILNFGGLDNHVLSKIGKERIIERGFVPAGQSSQMIIGATNETDYQIINVAEALYQKFDLKRVFYSAYVSLNEDKNLPVLSGGPPLLREHRLYQADWLLRYYGFEARELLSEKKPNFNIILDPKCDWAIAHLEQFPVEVNQADYFTLLRVPGIGMKSASRIIMARKLETLTFHDLKKIGVVLKRAVYFITCAGKMMYPTKLEEDYIVKHMIEAGDNIPSEFKKSGISYQQLSLFDDTKFESQLSMQKIQW